MNIDSKTINVTTEIKRNLILKASPPDPRDYKVSISTVQALSPSVDLSTICTSIKDQGPLGSCTAFASVGCLELLLKKFSDIKGDDILSERFTYYTTRVNILNWTPDDSGAYIRDAIKSLVKYGSCLEKTCPYNGDYSTKPTDDAYKEASNYQAITYARFDDGTSPTERKVLINSLKANLNLGFPIVCGFICYSNIWTAVSGVIPQKNTTPIGGHAIMIVGYDDNKQLFKFKNSWGTSWGDKGYGYLPYDYYYNGDMFDIWAIYKTELNNKVIGIDIKDPLLNRKIIRTDLSDLLSNIQENIDLVLDPAQIMVYFTKLLDQYKTKQDMRALINMLRIHITKMSMNA
jgi:C1A family cysteine protease